MKVFPDKKSWRYKTTGGPPGCYMALSRALGILQREGVVSVWYPPKTFGPGRIIRLRG